MSEGTQHIYGAEDFERYYSGKMNAAEMHSLEKAALDDIFLADALEGYSHTGTITEDKNDLKNKFQKNITRKSNFLYSTGFKVAAIFIIFAGLCWLLYNNNIKQDDIAMTTPAPINKTEPVAPNQFNGTVSIQSQDSQHLQNYQPEKEVTKKEVSVQPEHQVPINSEKNKTFTATDFKGKLNNVANAGSTEQNTNTWAAQGNLPSANVNTKKILKGRIIDAHGEPVPFATVMDKNTSQATSADNAGTYSLATKDSTPLIAVSALGFETYTRKINVDSPSHDIVLTETGSSRDVAAALKKEKSRIVSVPVKQIAEKADTIHRVTLINARPVIGWQAYYQYINKKLKTRQQLAAGENPIEISVTFSVNSKGEMKDILPDNTSCKQCIDEVVNILLGTRYSQNDKNIKATATVRF